MSLLPQSVLPWNPGTTPLMLAPMQGLTNRALRAYFIERVRPDVVFTEFIRVGGHGKGLAGSDRREICAEPTGVPLVVQLIGHECDGLVAAAQSAQAAGANHLNLNLGCPFGRMLSGPTGGGLLREPERLDTLLPALRTAITGSFSVKIRSGYDDPQQIFSLLPLFEAAGIDFLILHPRTVVQGYGGRADHRVTAAVVQQTHLPVIANGDIRTAADGQRLLRESGAAGLMLGRGALADPLLFARLRGQAHPEPDEAMRRAELRRYLTELATPYGELFCGEVQILGKLKDILTNLDDPALGKSLKQLKKVQSLRHFLAELAALG